MIRIRIKHTGPDKAIDSLIRQLTHIDTMGRILHYAASVIWIPEIERRLDISTSTSGYKDFLNQSLDTLDPEFVKRLGSGDWSGMSQAERKIVGGYRPGEITDKISQAIKASLPIKTGGSIAVGIADVDLLNQVFIESEKSGEPNYKIWQVLQWGTGVEAGGAPVIRTGKQIFFNGKTSQGVLAGVTSNPGFKGREYFVQLDGSIHKSDHITRNYVMKYITKTLKRHSYKGKI